jgi:hypothetical protein
VGPEAHAERLQALAQAGDIAFDPGQVEHQGRRLYRFERLGP